MVVAAKEGGHGMGGGKEGGYSAQLIYYFILYIFYIKVNNVNYLVKWVRTHVK